MGMEYYQRKQIYKQYIRSGTNSHLTIGSLDFDNDDNNDNNDDESKVNNNGDLELTINKDMTSSMIKDNNFNLINKEEYL